MENEAGNMIIVKGRDELNEFKTCGKRDELNEFKTCGKLKERIEITWKYESDNLPSPDEAKKMEEVETVIRKAMEKDKLAILTGIYTGGGERVWVFYTRTTRVFGERLNEALTPFELLPITLYAEVDPEWEEYTDMYEAKDWSVDN